jgi:hypothetical protein
MAEVIDYPDDPLRTLPTSDPYIRRVEFGGAGLITYLINDGTSVVTEAHPADADPSGERGWGWAALLQRQLDCGGSQLSVGVEFRAIVKLFESRVCRVGRMACRVGAYIPRRAGPPAEFAH